MIGNWKMVLLLTESLLALGAVKDSHDNETEHKLRIEEEDSNG